ncbi:MAG TPA: 30S ribosomal protein S7 [Candidatus Paceibacterota bacterium]|jgi:small subunit ribosomal protein S7|nr:30S ribosomal protein S7 [Candidatus Paceibacterota bacterium]HOQ15398.1 30S ribosomal protein S7 [Candidatus Paceibacterota bacterium]HPQ22798.1 30S ribosomal protein S7 [Candidatus Paceibacterota bacterium]HRR45545.1 30S ribosomal protein S7 [Candidatus Paceibacterota bacterium]
MRRKHREEKEYEPDLIYQSPKVTKFINYLTKDGKKTVARKVFYQAMEIIKEKTKQDPLNVFNTAIENISPEQELVSRRIGGANYQIPRQVPEYRKFILASRWIIESSRSKKGKAMKEKLADELILASQREGDAYKKKLTVEKMAEANKAFAQFSSR